MVQGKVNGKEVCILVDTGADYGIVPRAVVPENAVDCGRETNFRCAWGQCVA